MGGRGNHRSAATCGCRRNVRVVPVYGLFIATFAHIADFEAKVTGNIFTIDGELRELNRKKQPIIDKADIYGQLKGLAIERGYKPGFVYHKFKEYFGEKPRGLNEVPPRTPSQTIRNWVKSRHIAYVKARSRRAYRHNSRSRTRQS